MNYDYKVVSLAQELNKIHKPNAEAVRWTLERLIETNSSSGWEFYQLGTTHNEVEPGYLGQMLGQKISYVHCDVLIFRKGRSY